MSQRRYEPEGNTPVAILYANGWKNSEEIGEFLGVSPNTIRKWDREGEWRQSALQQIGFDILYKHECESTEVTNELIELRDKLDHIIGDREFLEDE